jgi:molybdenum cofactor biosynthesis enzyme MoaA
MINQRLFDHYGIDTGKDLKVQTRCARPFDTVLIDKQGSCYACECQSWLPQSIGNLQVMTLDEILHSETRREVQSSVSDGTYRYCNDKICSYLLHGDVVDKSTDHVEYLRLAIDDSCNLRCPSCRNGLIFHKSGTKLQLGIKLADKINRWLENYAKPIQVHMGSDGDPFASYVYRHFMEHTPRKDNIKYSILTNGLMFQDFHIRIPHVINKLDQLAVSIDGATEDTYEKLRLGGRWEKIKENLQSMAEMKAKHKFVFRLHMVVQQDNWWEMPEMIKLAEQYDVDQVCFNRVQDWNTALDYTKQTFAGLDQFKDLLHEVHRRPEKFNKEPRYLVKGFNYPC